MTTRDVLGTPPEMSARELIMISAYKLFTRRGIRAASIDEVIERAALAKAMLYRDVPTKR